MSVEASRSGATVTLVLVGDLDAASADQPVVQLRPLLGRQVTEWVLVDVTGVGFVDSTGLGALIRVRQEARRHGARTRLVGADPRLTRLLTITGLDQEFLSARMPPAPREAS